MIAIVAGDHHQYLNWCRENKVSTRITCYVHRELDILGKNIHALVLTGTYLDLPEFGKISTIIDRLKIMGGCDIIVS